MVRKIKSTLQHSNYLGTEFFTSGYPSLPDVSPLIIKDPRLSGKIGCQEQRKTRNSRGQTNGKDREEKGELELQSGGSSIEEGATRKFRVRESARWNI